MIPVSWARNTNLYPVGFGFNNHRTDVGDNAVGQASQLGPAPARERVLAAGIGTNAGPHRCPPSVPGPGRWISQSPSRLHRWSPAPGSRFLPRPPSQPRRVSVLASPSAPPPLGKDGSAQPEADRAEFPHRPLEGAMPSRKKRGPVFLKYAPGTRHND